MVLKGQVRMCRSASWSRSQCKRYGSETAKKGQVRICRSASWSRSHDLRHYPPPEGFSAIAPHQEVMHQEAILAGYCIPPSHMQSFPTTHLPPPAMPVGGTYFSPAGGAQDTLFAEFRAFQKAEAARTLKDNQAKEASMYEQLGRATAAATAISFRSTFSPTRESLHGMQTDYRLAQRVEAARTLREKQYREYLMYAAHGGRSHGTPFQYQGMSHVPPWVTLPSAANATVTPESAVAAPYFGGTDSYTGVIAAAPYQSPPPYHQPEANYLLHRGSKAAAAARPQTNDISSHPGGPLRHPTGPTSRERVRHPTAEAKKQPKKKLCRYYLKRSKFRNYSANRRIVPNKAASAADI